MKSMIRFSRFATPLGTMLLLAYEEALTGAYFEGQKYERNPLPEWRHDPGHPPLGRAQAQLAEYFAGARTIFDLPLAPVGTPFQGRVWKAIAEVPYGRTMTYGDLAREIGATHAIRGVGAATGRNPLSVIVPCHRIVGANGALTGYAGGLARKRALLELEARAMLARAA